MSKRNTRNLIMAWAFIIALALGITLSGCGSTEETNSSNEISYQVTGSVMDADGSTITIQKDDSHITFNYEGVAVQNYDDRDADLGDDAGDVAIISYTGELDGTDGTACTVTGITIMPSVEQRMTCELVDIRSLNSRLTVNDGTNQINLDVENAERHYTSGLKIGDTLVVTYLGEISGTDTSKAVVCAVYEESVKFDTNSSDTEVKEVSQNVWTKYTVNVREGSSTGTEVAGTLSAGTKIKRTGIGDDGWSRVEYGDGEEGYVLSSLIAKKKPETVEEGNDDEEADGNSESDENSDSEETATEERSENTLQSMTGYIRYLNVGNDSTTITFVSEGKYYNIGISDTEIIFNNVETTGSTVELLYEGDVVGGDSDGITVKTLQNVVDDDQ